MLRILLSNDDGVYAEGLNVLMQTLSKDAHVDVVAPDRNRSGASNSLTLSVPLHVKKIEGGRISVEGTPTDCVHVAITGLLEQRPDMVIAGINEGANLGDDVWYSGTVAAAMEGLFLGLPALAVSLAGEELTHYETAAKVVQGMLQHLIEHPLPPSTILNVNVPDIPFKDIQSYQITRLGTRHCAEPTIRQVDPRGKTVYWVGPAGAEEDAGPGTDFYAVRHQCVSITPLRVDITHYEAFGALEAWLKGLK
jgi:5'-nucleotidase